MRPLRIASRWRSSSRRPRRTAARAADRTPPADDLCRRLADRGVQGARPGQNYSFAGSNALETQIRNGAPADIFASAAPLNTQRLFKAGIVDKPVTFTANRLALIVPKSNPAGITVGLRPAREAGQARRRGSGRAGRRLHADGAAKMGLSGVLSKVVSR